MRLKSVLGFNIQKARKSIGISQEELSKRALVKYSNLTKIENGIIKNPTVYTIGRIAKALETSIEKLIY